MCKSAWCYARARFAQDSREPSSCALACTYARSNNPNNSTRLPGLNDSLVRRDVPGHQAIAPLQLFKVPETCEPERRDEGGRRAGGQQTRGSQSSLLEIRRAQGPFARRGRPNRAVSNSSSNLRGSEDGYQRECGAMGRSALWLLITACILEMVRPECCASHGMRIVVVVDR